MNIAIQGLANTLPFRVTDLRAFMQHISQVTGVHVVIINELEGRVFLEGTHGNWDLYATVHNQFTNTMEDELVDLEHLVSYPDPSYVAPQLIEGQSPEDLEPAPRISFLIPGEYVLFQWMGVKDGYPSSSVYGVNSEMESVSYSMDEMIQRAQSVLGTPEPGSLLRPLEAAPDSDDTSGPVI